MKEKKSHLLYKAIFVIFLVVVIDTLGVAFLALKAVSVPFVPNRNIDKMSDFYTALWQRENRKIIDNGRFKIVDVTDNSRIELAEILNTIDSMCPKVIGLDILHIWEENNKEDSILVKSYQTLQRIIFPVEYYDKENGKESFQFSIFHSLLMDKEYGVVSFPENRNVLRTYTPSFNVNNLTFNAFGCVIAEKYGVDIAQFRKKKNLIINYTTLKLSDEDCIPGRQFLNLDSSARASMLPEIADKIILIGCTHDTRDQHMTPLGNTLSGIMIHAHIINSLIEDKSIKSTPLIIRYLLCFVLAYISLYWVNQRKSKVMINKRIWKFIINWILIFVVSVIIFAIVGTVLFCKLNYYVDFSPYIVTLILVYLIKDKKPNFIKRC